MHSLSLVLLALVVLLFALLLYVFCMRDQSTESKDSTAWLVPNIELTKHGTTASTAA